MKVISVYLWVCAGPKKSKKEPEGRWRGGDDKKGVRASLTALPTWWKEMKMVSDRFFFFNSLIIILCHQRGASKIFILIIHISLKGHSFA